MKNKEIRCSAYHWSEIEGRGDIVAKRAAEYSKLMRLRDTVEEFNSLYAHDYHVELIIVDKDVIQGD
ncbi:MAG: hypothetical protein Q4Q17_01255 [Tissierellia bacterium]|nr:hypothetical protein [Tissierellia bacterium]